MDSGSGASDPQDWFEYWDDSLEEEPLSEAERVFLTGLRARAAAGTWPCDPADTLSYHHGAGRLLAGVHLDDPVSHHALLSFGVVFDGTQIMGNRIDFAEPFHFRASDHAAMQHRGSPASLVNEAAEWFEWLMSWPIERREWLDRGGEVVYCEWILANTKEILGAYGRWRPVRRPNRVTVVRGHR